MNRLTTPWGDLGLTRFPELPRETLRAWDTADEYLLQHLAGPGGDPSGPGRPDPPVDPTGSVVVVGDKWGALTTALAVARDGRPVTGPLTQITDSYLTQQATRANLRRAAAEGVLGAVAGPGADADADADADINADADAGAGSEGEAVRLLSVRDTPPGRIDVLLIRVPKSLALLEDQLHRLAPGVHPGTVVIGTGRVTEIHTSTLKLFEHLIGATRTSLAVRKARLIFSAPAPSRVRTPSPWPHSYALPDGIGSVSGRTVVNHAGIFCAERLDVGTRFLLRHLPRRSGAEHVIDLGCGNGVVGTAAVLDNPAARVTFIDESFSAVESARMTFAKNVDARTPAEFVVGDSLTDLPAGTADLVLNNPPFHTTHQATTDATAWRMFTGSRAALRPGGELWVVGNRHLGYHAKLRRLFGNCELVTSDPKFVVLRAVKR